jgi:hypothetical protein
MAGNPLEDLLSSAQQLPSYFFADRKSDQPLSYQSLQTRRKIAEALLGKRSPFPKTIGEGLTYLGESIADRRLLGQLDEAERGQVAREAGLMRGAPEESYLPGPAPAANPISSTVSPATPRATNPPGTATDTEYNALDAGADLNQTAYDRTFKGTPLEGKNYQIAEAAAKHGVSPSLIAAVMAHETGSGTSSMLRNRNNPGGIMDPRTNSMTGQSFPDVDAGIDAAGRVIANNFRRGGGTIEGMARSYAPPRANNDPTNLNRYWPGGVSKFNAQFTPQGTPQAAAGDVSPPSSRDAIVTAMLPRTTADDSSAGAPSVPPVPPVPPSGTAGNVPLSGGTATGADLFGGGGDPDFYRSGRTAALAGGTATDADVFGGGGDPGAGNPPIVLAEARPAPARPAADLLPSQQPIPLPKPQQMADPGPEPARPPRLGPSKAMQYWAQFIDNPNVSEAFRAHAQRQYALGEHNRAEQQAQEQETYKDKRELWQQKQTAYEKFNREEHDRNIEQLIKLQGVEKTNADLEEAYYKRGIPREQAREQARLDILKARREVSKPDTVTAAGTQFERQRTPEGAVSGEYKVPAGLPEAEEKAPTEGQAKAIEFVKRTQPDLEKADSNLGYGKALTSYREAGIAEIPGVHHLLLSEAYKNARDAYGNWGSAFLTHVSGAAVSPSEAMRNLPAFLPMPGDSDQRLRDKAARRRDMMRAVVAGGGKITKEAVLKANSDFMAMDRGEPASGTSSPTSRPAPGLREGRTGVDTDTGKEMIVRNGKWEPK